MAAANESQGLKIAVAAFVTLTVVLAVATYFTYSSYSEASAKLTKAQSDATTANTTASEAVRNLEALKERAGYGRSADFAGVVDAMTKDGQQYTDALTALNDSLKQAITDYQQAGGDQAKVVELTAQADQIVQGLTSIPEANRTQKEMIERLLVLLDDLGKLTTELVLDNEELRKSLKSVDQTNAEALSVESEAAAKANTDLANQVQRNEAERMELLGRYAELQKQTAEQATEIANLKQTAQQLADARTKEMETSRAVIREWRERAESQETVMDVADGRIQFVDYARGEVQTDLGRRDGVRERMQFSVFDRDAPGLPSDSPKGVVELVQVGDRSSVARIVRTNTPSDPIRDGDQLYSHVYDRNRPVRFALIGKMDMDRNGTDDRADLIRLIETSGGVIDYDLPPPGQGDETGELTGYTNWYVIDTREPIRGATAGAAPEEENAEYLTKRSAAIEKARESGVRPITIERLLTYLGYRYGEATPGQVEGVNRGAMQELTRPPATETDSQSGGTSTQGTPTP